MTFAANLLFTEASERFYSSVSHLYGTFLFRIEYLPFDNTYDSHLLSLSITHTFRCVVVCCTLILS